MERADIIHKETGFVKSKWKSNDVYENVRIALQL